MGRFGQSYEAAAGSAVASVRESLQRTSLWGSEERDDERDDERL